MADEPSDGVVREIITVETAPVRRRRPSSGAPPADRPRDITGEIATEILAPHAPPVDERRSEPSILVADLAAAHAAVSAVAEAQAAAPPTPDAAAPARDAIVAEVRADAAAFSDLEEAFFRAGHEAAVPGDATDSFEDLDRDYRPVGFWERLIGKLSRPAGSKS